MHRIKLSHLVVPFAVLLVDAYFFSQGVISVLIAFVVVLISVPGALLAWRRGDRDARWNHLRRLLTWPLVAAVVIALLWLQNARARRAAESIIAACETYEARHGHYPSQLSDLVPEELPSIPKARLTAPLPLWQSFDYFPPDETAGEEHGATLSYTSLPPFGREIYRFREKAWVSLD